MTDGPVGVRWQKSSAFPVSIMMAAGWDPALIEKLGAALGQEAKAKDRRMLLGPCVNIHRVPQGGRDFESFGEDPYLAARMAAAYVRGVQSQKVVATVKHYACNNQEYQRDSTNVTVSRRALHEIYFPAFEAAVKEGGALSVMSAYNKVNGLWCSENPYLLNGVLKDEWAFPGFVVSDWGAVHSAVPTANAGLDVEMPTGAFLNDSLLLPAVKDGRVPETVIDGKIRRLLRVMAWTGLFDGAEKDKGALNTPEHKALALEVAREGIVLLKNDRNMLPLDRHALKTVAVIGPSAAIAQTGGGGSSRVEPIYAVAPLEGMKKKAGGGITIAYAEGCRMEGDLEIVGPAALTPAGGPAGAHGLKGEYFANMSLQGAPAYTRIDERLDFDWGDAGPAPALPAADYSVRWTGKLLPPSSGRFTLSLESDDGSRLYVDGRLVIDNWGDHAALTKSATLDLVAGKPRDIRIEYYQHAGGAIMRFGWSTGDETLQAKAVEAAKSADVAVLFVGLTDRNESEGFDRTSLELPEAEVKLIKAVAAANRNTVVVMNSGAPVLMDAWLGDVPALLETWYPGEEGGNAVAEVLFGDVNPSGKLPMTFLRRWEDAPAYGNYPGDGAVDYAEGIFVGYRHFDEKHLDVAFPFGHGLSYASFAYSNLVVRPVKGLRPVSVAVSVEVKNMSGREGAEVVQLYVHDVQSSVPRPPMELKGFQRVNLQAGESKKVTFTLDERSFAYYDEGKKNWTVEPGKFEIILASSSRDIRARTPVTLE